MEQVWFTAAEDAVQDDCRNIPNSSPGDAVNSADGSTLQRFLSFATELERLARDAGEHKSATGAREISEKIEQNRFYLVVVGQFKRGKTSFLNALLGEPLLPVAVLPLTSVVTILRYAKSPAASVHFDSGEKLGIAPEQLPAYVTESGNPGNKKHVAYVEVFYPNPLLQAGLTLVDTPGIGSVYAHNTEVTRSFLPRIDAAIFVTSPEPPLTAAEIDFLRQLRERAASLFVVMNKTDLMAPEDLAEGLRFTEESLKYLSDRRVFAVSFRMALRGKQARDAALLEQSGLAGLEAELVEFLRHEQKGVFLRSIARQILEIIGELRTLLSLRVRAIQMPVDELRERIGAFEEQLAIALQQQGDNELLLNGSLAKLTATVEEQARALAASLAPILGEQVRRFLEQSRSLPKRRLAAATDEFIANQIQDLFETWRTEAEPSTVAAFREATTRFQRSMNDLAGKVRETAGGLFNIRFDDFEMNTKLVYLEPAGYRTDTLLDWGLGNAPLLLPRYLYFRYLLRSALKRVPDELERNATRVAYDLKRRLSESVAAFQRDLDRKLSAMIAGIRDGMQAGLEKHRVSTAETERVTAAIESALGVADRLRAEVLSALNSNSVEEVVELSDGAAGRGPGLVDPVYRRNGHYEPFREPVSARDAGN